MTKLERELLESIAGKRTHHDDGREIAWGAWMSACLEGLEGRGYLQANHRARGYTYEITSAGWAALSNGERK
jgi:hypothetical protein